MHVAEELARRELRVERALHLVEAARAHRDEVEAVVDGDAQPCRDRLQGRLAGGVAAEEPREVPFGREPRIALERRGLAEERLLHLVDVLLDRREHPLDALDEHPLLAPDPLHPSPQHPEVEPHRLEQGVERHALARAPHAEGGREHRIRLGRLPAREAGDEHAQRVARGLAQVLLAHGLRSVEPALGELGHEVVDHARHLVFEPSHEAHPLVRLRDALGHGGVLSSAVQTPSVDPGFLARAALWL